MDPITAQESRYSNEEKLKEKEPYQASVETISEGEGNEVIPNRNLFGRFIDGFKPAPEVAQRDEVALKKKLKTRHIQMIALGGAIGMGVWVGSGKALHKGGAGSVIINYSILGTMVFCTIYALGELAVAYPIHGGFTTYATRFIDPSWGFALGWNYLLHFLCTIPLELTVATVTIKFWTDVNSGIWITIFLVLLIIINLFGVKGYGEVEFALSAVKVIAMVGFIIFGIIDDVGGVPSDPRGYIGTSIISASGFRNGFKGFCSVFATAAFSFASSEMVGLAAAETKNPQISIPRSTHQVFWRISIFYVLALFVVTLLVRADDPRLTALSGTSASPFVIAIQNARVKALPSVMNAVITISVISATNAMSYAGSRVLQSLAVKGHAPKIFKYIDRQGRPLPALCLIFLFACLAYLNLTGKSDLIFNWLLALSSLSTLFTWASICLCHIRYRMAFKKQGKSLETIGFRSPLGIFGSAYAFVFVIVIFAAQFYVALFPIGLKPSVSNFFQNFLTPFVIGAFFILHKIFSKEKYRPLSELDLDSGLREYPVQPKEKKTLKQYAWSFARSCC
ncbi:amino acid permease inda1 [Schizosaccharomyces japonicus yFS275]|uniref:Amino acid permease inda1 n=1 Tax=Schizosaccharomyces japonicus (strain yFS275 / FY16936) TaxID=402676 RepID=B6K1N9_SCHJY|nr:amino acid permease inda1 [Schizosaccharomyces japonicus yFS275]EEB07070.1 amino acid permease inda1 [Schizosaccharomyces japonicus yFS275]